MPGWIETSPELFDTLAFLTNFLRKLGSGRYRLPSRKPRADEHEWVEELGSVWSLLNDDGRLETLISGHQVMFNRIGPWYPKPLLKYRMPMKEHDWRLEWRAAKEIIRSGEPVSLRKIAEKTGFSPPKVRSAPPELKEFVRTQRALFFDARLKRATEFVMATQVCVPLRAASIARAAGIGSYSGYNLTGANSALARLIADAKAGTRHYYSSFSCQNPKCTEFGQTFTGHIRLRNLERWHVPLTARIKCMACGRSRPVDVSAAPHHSRYIVP